MDYSLTEAAAQLEIAPSTLRKWSTHFAALLSDSARRPLNNNDPIPHRRYTEADIAILLCVKALLRNGRTYVQAYSELIEHPVRNGSSEVLTESIWISGSCESSGRNSSPIEAPGEIANNKASVDAGTTPRLQQRRRRSPARQPPPASVEANTIPRSQSVPTGQADDDLAQLELEDQVPPWIEEPNARLSYRAKIILLICIVGVFVGILAGAVVALLAGS